MNLLVWPIITYFLTFIASIDHVDLELGQGYQEASLNWNIAGPENTPTILSELKWKDLKIWSSHAAVGLHKGNCIIRCEGNYGKIFEGYNIDNDYGKDDRQALFSHVRSTSDCGEIYDLTVTMGYEICCSYLSVTPYGGWGADIQHLKMKSPASLEYNGNNNPFEPFDSISKGEIIGLNSKYDVRWQGPLAGLDVSCEMGGFRLFGGFEYTWLDLHAKGYWNLREEFSKPFQHDGKGHGTKIRLGSAIDLTCNWNLGLLVTLTDYHIENGVDRTLFASGNKPIEARTKLNAVHWHSCAIIANLKLKF